jgi:PIN domain nuclease of toxin-antitoxin system
MRTRIAEASCYVSVASIWEVAIKHYLRKLPVSAQRFRDEMAEAGVVILPIQDEHAIVSGGLALDRTDPFDRLLLATALVEGTRLATADAALIDAAERDRALPIFAVL